MSEALAVPEALAVSEASAKNAFGCNVSLRDSASLRGISSLGGNRLYARSTSAFHIRPQSYFRLLELSAKLSEMAESSTPQNKMEKGFKFYVSSYICNYEGSEAWTCRYHGCGEGQARDKFNKRDKVNTIQGLQW
ncbi:hypothetical protein ROHU_004393 [Labeo rohita]|uniref:Uncharacterized protein n=1 Tax=Labeo rohita TaxID=84645 RepID=A0A498NMU4_LABRO|nr:hypothetical protein ROHU_004393 [Labeo rohita]